MTASALDLLDGIRAEHCYVVYKRTGHDCPDRRHARCDHDADTWEMDRAYVRPGVATARVKFLTNSARYGSPGLGDRDVRVLVVRPGALEVWRGDHDENLAVHERAHVAHVEEIDRMQAAARAAQDAPAKKPRRRRVTCETCEGTCSLNRGIYQFDAPCATCRGEGTVLR